MMLIVFFVVAFFAIVATMSRGVSRKADARLRAQYDAEGARGDVSRQLMRNAGYDV
ncbi:MULTISPECIES: hypothetical protein [Burkholderia]|uniref:Uncharacterized protein n=2 Tax=Burkholderia anthina TaxID=179879 RepID=A0ABS2B5W2_9BURK|nr:MULTISPECIES: hypothetical protein [Burkholderia]MBM2768285.1 hypothetical protein [Burkholderia anthina]